MNEKNKKGKIKGCIVFFIVIYAVYLIGMHNIKKMSSAGPNNRIIKNVASLNDEQLNKINDIFSLCQIKDIVDAKQFKVGESKTSYHINENETSRHPGADHAIILWLDNNDKSVQEIYYNDNDIYINGQVVNVITKFYIPKDLYEEYRVMGQLALKSYLKHPKTVKYKEWRDGVLNGIDTIQVKVTSKNEFNMDVISQIKFEYNRDAKRLTKIHIDGRQVY